jgi:hypothetical protein
VHETIWEAGSVFFLVRGRAGLAVLLGDSSSAPPHCTVPTPQPTVNNNNNNNNGRVENIYLTVLENAYYEKNIRHLTVYVLKYIRENFGEKNHLKISQHPSCLGLFYASSQICVFKEAYA